MRYEDVAYIVSRGVAKAGSRTTRQPEDPRLAVGPARVERRRRSPTVVPDLHLRVATFDVAGGTGHPSIDAQLRQRQRKVLSGEPFDVVGRIAAI